MSTRHWDRHMKARTVYTVGPYPPQSSHAAAWDSEGDPPRPAVGLRDGFLLGILAWGLLAALGWFLGRPALLWLMVHHWL